jgi:hypothetical protein
MTVITRSTQEEVETEDLLPGGTLEMTAVDMMTHHLEESVEVADLHRHLHQEAGEVTDLRRPAELLPVLLLPARVFLLHLPQDHLPTLPLDIISIEMSLVLPQRWMWMLL